MNEQGYNGWTNWDTWNVNLILDNEEELYNRKQALGRRFHYLQIKGQFDIDKAAKAVRLYLLPIAIRQDRLYGGGMTAIDRKAVNCLEIAQAMLDDAIENAAYEDGREVAK